MRRGELYFEDNGHDQGAALGFLRQKALQVGSYFFLHHAPVASLFRSGILERLGNDCAALLQDAWAVTAHKATADDFRKALTLAGVLVDRDDREHKAILRQMTAVADDDVFDHVIK